MIVPFLLILGLYSLASLLRLLAAVLGYAFQTSPVVSGGALAPETVPVRSKGLSG